MALGVHPSNQPNGQPFKEQFRIILGVRRRVTRGVLRNIDELRGGENSARRIAQNMLWRYELKFKLGVLSVPQSATEVRRPCP